MSTNIGLQIASLEGHLVLAGGSANSYEALWHAVFDGAAIPTGTFNERLLAFINAQLVTSYDDLPRAMQEYAVDRGFFNWDSMGTFTVV